VERIRTMKSKYLPREWHGDRDRREGAGTKTAGEDRTAETSIEIFLMKHLFQKNLRE